MTNKFKMHSLLIEVFNLQPYNAETTTTTTATQQKQEKE